MATAPVGGAETFFLTLTLALARAGMDMRTALRPSALREADLAQAGIPYDTMPFHTYFDFKTKRILRRVLREFRPDAVLTFTQRASLMMPTGNFPLIGRMGGYYKLKYYRHCDHITCITPDIMKHVIDGGWPKGRVGYIPNFPIVQDDPPIKRADLDTPDGAPVALALGRLHINKALDVLLQAAKRLPDLYVWIAGEGPLRAELTKLAADLGIAGRVRFLGWRTDRSALLRAADVCVFPSRWEPNGTVVVEAWAHGTPLVTTASAGPAWITRPNADAVVTPVDDAGALAVGIRSVLASPEMRARLIANGLARVKGEFSEAAVVGQYIELFQRLSAEKRVRAA